jgi:acyl carrier protein
MSDLNLEIKKLIIQALMLEDITPADIHDDEPLFVEGLGLDSIDALELGMVLQKKYGIAITANSSETQQYFSSINALANMVSQLRTI